MVLTTGLPSWPGWSRLPREARDVLFVLAVIAWTMLPHLAHVPWWCGTLAALVLLWRGSLALSNAALPRRWAVFAVLAIALGLTLWTHRTLLGKEAGVTMLVVLMVLLAGTLGVGAYLVTTDKTFRRRIAKVLQRLHLVESRGFGSTRSAPSSFVSGRSGSPPELRS